MRKTVFFIVLCKGYIFLVYNTDMWGLKNRYEQPFVEAVRKKEERRKLTGTTCKCCADVSKGKKHLCMDCI